MDATNSQTNQQINQQTIQPTIQETSQQTPTVKKRNKSTNTLMLVLAGLGTAIGNILSSGIGSVVTGILFKEDNNSWAYYQMSFNLNVVISFLANAIILLICAAISCKKATSLLKFLVCCISGKAIGTFIGSIIMTVAATVCYFKDFELITIEAKITFAVQILMIIFSSVFAVLLLLFLTAKEENEKSSDIIENGTQSETQLNSANVDLTEKSPKSRGAAIVLCIFLGTLGIHRFYTEKVGTGILWLLTGGLFGIGVIVDFFMLLFGGFKDADGLRL